LTERFDVAVIGAGPIGAVAARCAAECGARTVLLERRGVGTTSSACTGLVSPRTLPLLGLSDRSVLRPIRSVEAFGPSGRRVALRANETKALVLDRTRLEQDLLDLARQAGVDVRFGCDVDRVCGQGITYQACESSGRKNDLKASVTLIASGPGSSIAQRSGLPSPASVFPSAQLTVEAVPFEEDTVSVFLGSSVAPGFFAWAVPAEEGLLRVGLATADGSSPQAALHRLCAERFPGVPIVKRSGGPIAIGPVADPVRDGLLLVGDAAGHVKPLSGGGLYIGGLCARIAGRVAAEAAASCRTEASDLIEYSHRCDRAVGRELRFGLAARRLFNSLSDGQLDEALAALDQPDLLTFLAGVGDIDRLRPLPKLLLKERKLWRRLLPFLRFLEAFVSDQETESSVAPALADFL